MPERLRRLEPYELNAEQRALYARIVAGPRARGPQAFPLTDADGSLEGPFNALLVAPEVGTSVADLGTAIRYHSSLSPRCREIAILELAVFRRCEFEWYAHVRVGAAAGLTPAECEALLSGAPAGSFDRAESLIRATVRELLTARDLDAESFAQCAHVLGERALMELIALVGYYDLLALSLRVWRTPLPAGVHPVFGESESDAGGVTEAG